MKLNALNLQFTMPQPHDDFVRGVSRNLETRRQRFPFNNERVITACQKLIIHSSEDCSSVVMDRRRFAVHQLRRAHHFSAKRLTDSLVAQADTEQRDLSCESLNDVETNSGIVRGSWPRRDHNAFRT